MRLRDLGPIVVDVDGQSQTVGGARGAAMLALLAINVNSQVSSDALIEAAWGEDVTGSAGGTLMTHIWRLRQLLEPHRRPGELPSLLVADGGGYRLIGGPSSVDSLSMAAAAVEVHNLMLAGHAAAALRQAQAVLDLWRGRPYGVFADKEWAQAAVARLEEMRSNLDERRIEALLACGDVERVLSDIEPLIAAMPYRETLRQQQMLALYRSGRSEQALKVYDEVRRTLIDEIGIEPGSDLRELHRKVLDQDDSLLGPDPSQYDVSRPQPRVPHLPATLTPLVGRDQILGPIAALVETHPLVTVTGPAGCGKTRLAVEVARSASHAFQDGTWFVDLAAVADPGLVVESIISTLKLAPSAGTTPEENLSSFVRSRSTLLVLDNCEHVLDAVAGIAQKLLDKSDGSTASRILATSREPLDLDAEVIWTLTPLDLPSFDDRSTEGMASSVELFVQRLQTTSPELDIDDEVLAQIADICRAVDGLPLAIELAAARALSFSLADILTTVTDDPGQLGRVGRRRDDRQVSLRSTIEWSHRLMTPEQQLCHRRLCVLPGPFTSDLAHEVVQGGRQEETNNLLAELVYGSMLVSVGPHSPAQTTTFRQLVTVRSHARAMLAETGEIAECEQRRDDWTRQLLRRRPPIGTRAESQWNMAVEENYPAVRATLENCLLHNSSLNELQPSRLGYYWYYRGQLAEANRWLDLSIRLTRNQASGEAVVRHTTSAGILCAQGRVDDALRHVDKISNFDLGACFEQRTELCEALVGLIGSAWLCQASSLVTAMQDVLSKAALGTDATHIKVLTAAANCVSLASDGRMSQAISEAINLQEDPEAEDVPMARWLAAGPPMVYALYSAKPDFGIPWANRSIRDYLEFGGTDAIGVFVGNRANYAAQKGDFSVAAQLYSVAFSVLRRTGAPWPWRKLSLDLIELTHNRLSETAYQNAWHAGERLSMHEMVDLCESTS